MKKIYLILLLFLISWSVFSQKTYIETRKLSIGLDLGYPIYNYNHQLDKVFRNQEYDIPTPCWGFFSPCEDEYIEHPKTFSSPYFGIDVSYLLPNMKEVGLRISIWNSGDISGYHEKYGHLNINFKKNSFTPYYGIINLNQRLQLDVGVSANFIKFYEPLERFDDQKYFRPGLMVGGNFGIIEKRSHYLRLTTQANLMIGTVKIGPYDLTFWEDGNPITEQGFEEEKLWLPEVFFFISYGRKF